MNHQEQSVKKILMTADTIGGVWTYALDLCRALEPFDIEVCLATMGAPLSDSQQSEADEIANLEVRQSNFKLEWMDDPWDDVAQAGEWLLELEKETEPDIIHLNGYSHAALHWNSPVLVVAHSCVLSWWEAVKKEPAPLKLNEYKQRVGQGLRAADAVVSVSHTYAAELERLYGFHNNLSVIYNGRDADSFYTFDKKNQAFAMGRVWDEAKNLAFLGKISNNAKYPILIAGDNYHPNTRVPIDIPNVQLLGVLSQAEVKMHLAESYIYILPAKYEPFGLSVLEAALSGCLLLLSDIPTFKELWQNTALYFSPDKPEELDHLLNGVIQHPEIGKRLIERSTVRARIFSLETMTENYLNLYQSLRLNSRYKIFK